MDEADDKAAVAKTEFAKAKIERDAAHTQLKAILDGVFGKDKAPAGRIDLIVIEAFAEAHATIAWMKAALIEAEPFVHDAVDDEDPEAARRAGIAAFMIGAALAALAPPAAEKEGER